MKKFLWLVCSGLLPLAILCLSLYLFDPLQLFHKPYFHKRIFNSNMHYQAAGIINHYQFDSMILGSSIMVNTSSSEATKRLGHHWVNLSVSGGGLQERMAILQHALRKQNIRNVILSLESGWLGGTKEINRYAYLYDTNPLNDFKTYIEESFIFCLFVPKICLKGSESLDRPSRWDQEEWVQALLGGFQFWLKNKNRPDVKKNLEAILNYNTQKEVLISPLVPRELLTILKQYPKIQFLLIIPPFSRLNYKLNPINIQPAIQEILSLHLPNVKIYGFDDTSIPDDLSQYIDLAHYSPSINSYILQSIQQDTHRITLENIDSYFRTMQEKIWAYDIESLKKQILVLPEFKNR